MPSTLMGPMNSILISFAASDPSRDRTLLRICLKSSQSARLTSPATILSPISLNSGWARNRVSTRRCPCSLICSLATIRSLTATSSGLSSLLSQTTLSRLSGMSSGSNRCSFSFLLACSLNASIISSIVISLSGAAPRMRLDMGPPSDISVPKVAPVKNLRLKSGVPNESIPSRTPKNAASPTICPSECPTKLDAIVRASALPPDSIGPCTNPRINGVCRSLKGSSGSIA